MQYLYSKFPQYIGAADIFRVDLYPVQGETTHMKSVHDSMKAAIKTFAVNGKIANWGVPQIHDQSVYNPTLKSVYPSETQMRSISLLMAAMGAKGFIMYSYPDIIKKTNRFKDRWPEVCRVAQMLRDLEPFLLSDMPNPKLELNVIKGKIEAKALTADNGKTCVIIAAIGPGQAEANIKLKGADKLKSQYGRSILNSNGSWTFKGKDIDSDILFPVK